MPRLRTTPVPLACLGLLLALLGACATPHAPMATVAYWRMDSAALRDPPLERYFDQRLAAIAPAGPAAASVLMRPPGMRAEWRQPGAVLLWIDLLLRVVDDDELSFVLAHELGHAALGHAATTVGAGAAGSLLEQQADRWARDRIVAMGFRRDAGITLLRALAEELGEDPARTAVHAEILLRLDAMQAWPTTGRTATGAAPAEWPALQRARREAWATMDPSLRDDPIRAARVRARWR